MPFCRQFLLIFAFLGSLTPTAVECQLMLDAKVNEKRQPSVVVPDPVIKVAGFVRKPTNGRVLTPETPQVDSGPKNFKSCPFGKSAAADGATVSPPGERCPTMLNALDLVRQPDEAAKVVAKEAEKHLNDTRALFKKIGNNTQERKDLLNILNGQRKDNAGASSRAKRAASICNATDVFRAIDGTCNNLQHPSWGAANVAFPRKLPAQYNDLINTPRQRSVTGANLPGPRHVSVVVNPTYCVEDRVSSHWLMNWGQFIDHDITLTLATSASSISAYLGTDLCQSCTSANDSTAVALRLDCLPIPIPADDPYYPATVGSPAKPRCLSFQRSLNGQTTKGPREQMNGVTAYLDASMIYGSNSNTQKKLRSLSQGKMATSDSAQKLLPFDKSSATCFTNTSSGQYCFLAGDGRANIQIALTGVHTMFMREHNRIAAALYAQKPNSSDEVLFQQTRRIIGAMIQHITYNEWLPLLLGPTLMSFYGLTPLTTGTTVYDAKCDATLFNEFSTAALRFGHTLVQGQLRIHADSGTPNYRNLETKFFEPSEIYNLTGRFLDRMTRGMADQPAQTADAFITSALRDRLLETPGIPFSGSDLVARNIQRGRDHGLPPWTDYRKAYGLSVPANFADPILGDVFYADDRDALAYVYADVRDIDLYTGLIAEKPAGGSAVGPLLGRMLAEQFANLKKCDRFYYEHGGQAGSFTSAQLAQIRKATLAKVLCTHSGYNLQKEVFKKASTSNPNTVACSSLPSVDLTKWF